MKSGAVSEDFPLHHNKFIPTYQNPNEKKYTHNISIINNTYTNEHPDLFRLDGMKEGGYFNPFLNQIIKVDRNEYYKKLSLDRKNINFIDFMKTHRQYSQNPKLTRYISSCEEIELKRKRMALKNKNLSYTRNDSNCNNYLLTEINKNNDLKKNYNKEYNNLIKTLNHFVPKIDYRIKNTLKINDVDNKKNNNSNNDIENDNIYKKLLNINTKQYNNLRNINNYQINKTTMGEDDEFSFDRKQIHRFNPIRDNIKIINPPSFKNGKWSTFLENYYLMANTGKKFQRKGGLLTEFCNRNIININNEKNKVKENLKKKIINIKNKKNK